MKTIYRKRVKKTRYGLSNGECFVGVHFGKRSLYVAKPKSKRIQNVSLKAIKDDQGFVDVTATHTNYYTYKV
jgi:hypothetical protein